MTQEDLQLIREIVSNGGAKYTAGNIDRTKYQRLVDLGWLSPVTMNKTDIVYETTEAGYEVTLNVADRHFSLF
jgi:hypothetical protein